MQHMLQIAHAADAQAAAHVVFLAAAAWKKGINYVGMNSGGQTNGMPGMTVGRLHIQLGRIRLLQSTSLGSSTCYFVSRLQCPLLSSGNLLNFNAALP